MSNIDERIVKMTFDNQMFEKNVATSIKTLNDLKAAMNFDNATASLGNIEKTIGNVNFSKLEDGIDRLSQRFSTLGIAGMTVIQDLTRAAERMGMSLYNNTLGQIKTGGWNRATNIDKARFAVEGLKMSWDDLEPSISAAVNDTRFGFDEAATAASQLAASNVQVGDDMTNALKSIANVASQTGAEYSEIGHIYTVVAGNGKLMTEQMQQFSYRGFNAAAAMADVWGKTEAEVREMVSKGEVDFKKFSDAMNEYLGEGAQRANSTFEGSFANMKAALSRIGQPFAKSYRDAMIPVFNSLKEFIKDIKGRIEPLEKIFEDFAQKASHLFTGLVGKIDLSFVDWIVDKLQKAYNWFDGVMSKVTPLWSKATEIADKTSDTAKKVVETADYVDEMAQKFIRGDYGNGVEKRRAAMEELGYSYEKIQNRVNELLGCSFRYDVAEEEATKTTEKNTEATKENAKEVKKATGVWSNQVSFMQNATNIISSWPKKIADAFSKVIDKDSAISKLASIISGVRSAFEIVGKTVLSIADGAIAPASETIAHLINIFLSIGSVVGSFLTAVNKILTALGAFDALKVLVAGIANVLSFLSGLLDGVVSTASNGLVKVFDTLGNSVVAIRAWFDNLIETVRKAGLTFSLTSILSIGSIKDLISKGINKIKKAFKGLIEYLGPVGKVIHNVFEGIKNVLTSIGLSAIVSIPKLSEFKEKGIDLLRNGFKNLGSVVENAKTRFSNFVESLKVNRDFRAFASKLREIKDALKTFAKDGIEAVKKSFSELIKKPFDLKNIQTVFSSFGKSIKTAFTNLFNNLPKISFSGIKQGIFSIFDWIKNEIKNFKLPKIDLPFKKELFDLLDKNGLLDRIGPVVSNLKDRLKSMGIDFSGVFKMAGKNVSKFFENIKRSDALHNLHIQFESLKRNLKKLKASGFEGLKKMLADFGKKPFDFSGVKSAFTNVVNLVKDGFKNIELPKIDFSAVKEAVLDTIEWVKDKIKNFKFPKIDLSDVNFPFKKQLSRLVKKLNPILAPIRDTLQTIGRGIGKAAISSVKLFGDAFKGAYEKASIAADKIHIFFEGLTDTPTFSNGIHGLSKAFQRLFAALRNSKLLEAVTNWFKDFGSIFTKYDGNMFTFINAIVEQISKPIGAALTIVGKTLLKFFDFIEEPVFTVFSGIASIISKIVAGIIDAVTKTGKKINEKNVFKTITDIVTKAAKLLLKIKLVSALKGILDFISGIGDIMKNVGKILKSTSKVLNQFANGIKRISKAQAKLMKAKARDYNATALLKLAGAILVLAIAFKLLSTINWNQFEVAAAAIIVIAGALAVLMLVAGRNKGGNSGESAIDSIGAGLESLGKSIQKGLKNIGKAALIFAFVYAVKSILDTIKELTDFNWADAKNGIKIMGAIMAELVLSMALLNLSGIGGSFGKNIGMTAMLLAFTLAIRTMVDSIATLAEIDEKGLRRAEKTLKRMIKIFGIFTIIFGLIGNGTLNFNKNKEKKSSIVLPILAMVGALLAITWSLSTLADIKTDNLNAARNAITFVSLAVAALGLGIGNLAETVDEIGGKATAIAFGGVALLVAEIVGSFILLDKLKVKSIDKIGKGMLMGIGAVALLGYAVAKIGEIDIDDGAMLTALKILGICALIITGLGVLLFGIEKLVDYFAGDGQFEKFLDRAGVVLEKFGGMLGKFIGGFAGGILKGISHMLFGDLGAAFDAFPKKLSEFAENLQPFLETVADIDGDSIDAFKDLILSLAEIFGLEALDDIFNKLGWTDSSQFDEFGVKLKAFANAISEFSSTVKDKVNEKAVRSAANAGLMLADLEAHIPNSGGKLAEWLGDNTLGKMSLELVPFAKAIVKYSAIVSAVPISEEAVRSSANAGLMLADLEAHIPNTGGALANWIGDNTLKKFAEGLEPFAKGIVVYSSIVSANPINEEAVKSSANAGLMLADLERHIPNTGGSLATLIFGDNRLDEFGDRMYQFGLALVKYSTVVSGNINYGAVTASKMAGQMLANLENSISNQGGFIEFMVGDNSIENFGTRLEAFGESMVNFSSILSGDYANSGTNIAMAFQSEVVEGVIGTIQKLVDFVNVINEGGDFDKFEENMSKLEGIELIMLSQLEHLGEMLGAEDSDYQKSFEDIGKKVIDGLNAGIQNALGEDDNGQSKSLATALVEGLTDESFISKVKTESETVGSTIAGAIAGITDEDGELTAFTEGLITSFTEMLNTVSTSVEGQATEFIEVGIRWAAGIVTGLRSNTAVNSVNQAARNLGNSALTTLRGMSSSFSSIGSGWASSLTSGLSSSQTRLTQSARTLGTSTGQAFTTAYQTATSNVFSTTGTTPGTTGAGTRDGDGVGPKAEKAGKAIGEFVSKGIVEGSEKNVDSFASSVTTMASYANAVMNEALDTNPVITPVLDMSNIQANAGLMNNYLNDSFSMGTNASSYTSSLLSGVSIKQVDNTQNQMNALATQEALNGIRQDIKDLGESMSHMQMVMNNGALVGQIGRGMDKQLGSIQKFKERWA